VNEKKWLDDTIIYRGGYDVPKKKETEDCQLQFNKKTQALELSFKIASKGGGETHILVRMHEGDFPAILNEIGEAAIFRRDQMSEMNIELSSLRKNESSRRIKTKLKKLKLSNLKKSRNK
jgi:hypothetical protein